MNKDKLFKVFTDQILAAVYTAFNVLKPNIERTIDKNLPDTLPDGTRFTTLMNNADDRELIHTIIRPFMNAMKEDIEYYITQKLGQISTIKKFLSFMDKSGYWDMASSLNNKIDDNSWGVVSPDYIRSTAISRQYDPRWSEQVDSVNYIEIMGHEYFALEHDNVYNAHLEWAKNNNVTFRYGKKSKTRTKKIHKGSSNYEVVVVSGDSQPKTVDVYFRIYGLEDDVLESKTINNRLPKFNGM
jgi:hypothetical protein